MSARCLLEVAIRVLGLWLVVTSIGVALAMLSYLLSMWIPATPGSLRPRYLTPQFLAVGLQGLFGIVLTWRAPWIAEWFYPPEPDEDRILLNVSPGDAYRIASFLFGVFLLVHVPEPTVRLIVAAMNETIWGNASAKTAADAISAGVYLVAGLGLLFGSRGIGQMLSSIRYDPDRIPRQQISLWTILAAIAAFAVVLGLVRLMTRGGI